MFVQSVIYYIKYQSISISIFIILSHTIVVTFRDAHLCEDSYFKLVGLMSIDSLARKWRINSLGSPILPVTLH